MNYVFTQKMFPWVKKKLMRPRFFPKASRFRHFYYAGSTHGSLMQAKKTSPKDVASLETKKGRARITHQN